MFVIRWVISSMAAFGRGIITLQTVVMGCEMPGACLLNLRFFINSPTHQAPTPLAFAAALAQALVLRVAKSSF
ncbi:MAG: hypothetical protein DHS20C08_17290 [Rhodomicrobium sp.]|nr:MAG: hypothetical protein DHS20C08_17290 [Rhodomicrobium sp.]